LIPTTGATDSSVRDIFRSTGFQSVPALSNSRHGLETPATESIKVDAFDEFIPQCDLVLTKSGTSTVHIAAYDVPMIVVYHVNPLLWHLVGRWLVKTKKIAMVNILAGQTDLVPE